MFLSFSIASSNDIGETIDEIPIFSHSVFVIVYISLSDGNVNVFFT
jgi:hypothetical protein